MFAQPHAGVDVPHAIGGSQKSHTIGLTAHDETVHVPLAQVWIVQLFVSVWHAVPFALFAVPVHEPLEHAASTHGLLVEPQTVPSALFVLVLHAPLVHVLSTHELTDPHTVPFARFVRCVQLS